jgi:hypothetical protein
VRTYNIGHPDKCADWSTGLFTLVAFFWHTTVNYLLMLLCTRRQQWASHKSGKAAKRGGLYSYLYLKSLIHHVLSSKLTLMPRCNQQGPRQVAASQSKACSQGKVVMIRPNRSHRQSKEISHHFLLSAPLFAIAAAAASLLLLLPCCCCSAVVLSAGLEASKAI